MKQLTLFPEPTPTLKASTSATESPFASAFDHFTLEQRKQIIAWNEKHTYDETADLIQKNFGITVSRSSLGRFHARTALINHIEESPDTQAAADLILLHISSPNPNNHKLTAASLHILEQTAFKLALTCADKPAHLDLLNRVNLIICRARNTAVRERHATVQEIKCTLRSREIDLKEKLTTARLNPNLPNTTGGTRSPSPTSTSRDDLSTHHAAPADQKTSPHVAQNFSLPPSNHTPTSRTATTQSEETTAAQNPRQNPVHPSHRENPVKNPSADSAPSANSALIPAPSSASCLSASTAPEIHNSKFFIPNSPSAPADPSDDPFLHIEGLLNGTIKPSWIPAEIPCDEEETFLDVWLRNRNKRLQAETAANTSKTLNPGNGS
jgi:hypothetical protein